MRHTTTIQSVYHLVFRRLFSVCLACMSALPIYSLSYSAGITTDGSMGTAKTLTPTVQAYTIPADLGQQKGTNLFHSFGDFNVNTGYSATFTGTAGTTNVIGRVTGGNPSSIDGRLTCRIAGANLWLLNPSGILFGPNASLNVKGSFHASTADYLQLSDGGTFYTNPSKTSKLTTAPPSAFGFLSSKPADIEIKGSTLKVSKGESLSIIGGDIRIEDGHLVAPGGRVNLASLGSPGTVEIVSDGLKVEAPNGLGDIHISNSMKSSNTVSIDVSGVNSGDISGSVDIYCKTFSLDHSEIISSNYSNLYKGGNIRLVAEKSASIANSSQIRSNSNSSGSGGDIDIQTGYLSLTNGGKLAATTPGSGNAGNVSIKAMEVLIDGGFENSDGLIRSGIASQATKNSSSGIAGNINIVTESLTLSNGGQISASTLGSGKAGDLTINANDVTISGSFESKKGNVYSSGLYCNAWENSSGFAGNLNITTESLKLSNGGLIEASTEGTGNGGVVTITANDVMISGGFESTKGGVYQSGLYCNARENSSGYAGNLNITTESLKLSNGGRIEASTKGTGNGGVVTITANNVSIDGGCDSSVNTPPSGIYSFTHSKDKTGTAKAGRLNIDTESLTLTNGGQIAAATFVRGDGGVVTITAKNVSISGGSESSKQPYLSGLYCRTETDSTGNAGSLNIVTESLTMSNGGQISASTTGSGKGGVVSINAKDISIDGYFEASNGVYSSEISCKASSSSSGNAGNVILLAETLSISEGGKISVTNSGKNAGGNIEINVGALNMNSGAAISSASTGNGDAGNINLTVAGKLEIRDSTITTESKKADGGDITITTGFLTWLVDSAVTATVAGGPKSIGGNIRINSTDVVLNDSRVIANAYKGKGGSIGITADTYLADWTSTVSASSTLGINGQVDINSPPVNLSGLLSPLPTAFVDISELLANDCETRHKHRKASSLVVRGRDAPPAQPGDLWPSPVMMQ